MPRVVEHIDYAMALRIFLIRQEVEMKGVATNNLRRAQDRYKENYAQRIPAPHLNEIVPASRKFRNPTVIKRRRKPRTIFKGEKSLNKKRKTSHRTGYKQHYKGYSNKCLESKYEALYTLTLKTRHTKQRILKQAASTLEHKAEFERDEITETTHRQFPSAPAMQIQ